MKITASLSHPMFIHPPLPLTTSWGESRTQRRRRQPLALSVPALSTDALAASKPEIVCGGILGLCFFYTLCHVFMQLAA